MRGKAVRLGCWIGALVVAGAGIAMAQSAGNPGLIDPNAQPKLRVVTQGELDRYLVVLEGLIDAGLDAERELGVDPSQPEAMATAIRYSEDIQKLVKSQGFDEISFGEVHTNVMRAYFAESMSEYQAQMAAARAQQEQAMAQMRQHMTAEQAAAMAQALSSSSAMMQAEVDAIPKENIALIAKNRARIEAIFEKAKAAD